MPGLRQIERHVRRVEVDLCCLMRRCPANGQVEPGRGDGCGRECVDPVPIDRGVPASHVLEIIALSEWTQTIVFSLPMLGSSFHEH